MSAPLVIVRAEDCTKCSRVPARLVCICGDKAPRALPSLDATAVRTLDTKAATEAIEAEAQAAEELKDALNALAEAEEGVAEAASGVVKARAESRKAMASLLGKVSA